MSEQLRCGVCKRPILPGQEYHPANPPIHLTCRPRPGF